MSPPSPHLTLVDSGGVSSSTILETNNCFPSRVSLSSFTVLISIKHVSYSMKRVVWEVFLKEQSGSSLPFLSRTIPEIQHISKYLSSLTAPSPSRGCRKHFEQKCKKGAKRCRRHNRGESYGKAELCNLNCLFHLSFHNSSFDRMLSSLNVFVVG